MSAATGPSSRLGAALRALDAFGTCGRALLGCGLALLVILLSRPPLVGPEKLGAPDSVSYFATADGRHEDAAFYYAGRVLHPWTAAGVARVLGEPLPDAFRLVSGLSLVVLFAAVAAMVRPLSLLPFLVMAAMVQAYRYYYVPDLFQTAASAVFFLVSTVSPWLGLPVLFLMHLTRESTLFLSLVVAAVSLWGRPRFAAATFAIAVAGMATTSALIGQGAGNPHGLPMLFFDVAKVAFNTAANFLGVVVWTNTIAATVGCLPTWTMPVSLGSIKVVGVCAIQYGRPLDMLIVMGSSFGILPLVVWMHRRTLVRSTRLRTALAFGLLSFVTAPIIGGNPVRYVLYAWPLFWLGGAEVLGRMSGRHRTVVVLLSLIASWTPTVVGSVASLLVLAGLYWVGRRVVEWPADDAPLTPVRA